MIKKPIHYIIFISLFFSSSSFVLAQTATPSLSPTPPSDQVTIIRNIVQQNLATAEAMYRKAALVGYVGKITAISTQSITFKTNGDVFQVKTGDSTSYNKGGATKFTSLAISDKAIVIGSMTTKDIIDAKRIVVIKDESAPLSSIVSGKILTANTKTRLITIQTKTGKKDFILSRKATTKITDFVTGKPVVAIIELQEEDQVITTAKVF